MVGVGHSLHWFGCCFDCFVCFGLGLLNGCVVVLGYLLLCSFALWLLVSLFVRFWFCGLVASLLCLFIVCMFVGLLDWFVVV